jgi:hypothetical protein
MAVLGILTCEILELEFAHLLATDPDVAGVTVLEDARSAHLIELLESRGLRNLQRIPHIRSYHPEPTEQLEVVIRVMELGLHRNRKVMQQALMAAARELGRHLDALLLGYGLCGNALGNPEELLDLDIPVFIPMDKGHPVDDCVGLLIGGRECYYAEQCKTPGTFFMTPGWACHWRKIFEGSHGAADDALKRLFAHYERSLLIVTPVMREDEMKRRAEEFNQLLGLRVETRQGTLDLLTETWNSAKAEVLKSTADPGACHAPPHQGKNRGNY